LEASREALKQQSDELQKANEKLAAASRAKDRFLATMSHELRTPLNAIIGFAGMLRMKLPGPLTDAQDKQVGTIQASAKHLLSLINDLLDLARIESGKVELNPETIVAQDVIAEVLAMLQPMAEKKGVRLISSVPDAEVPIAVDRRALVQIIVNLATNGIKYTKVGTVTIALVQRSDGGRALTEIAVSDTGIGIKEEEQTKLFRAFERVGDPHSRNEGTGLGLYLSRRLAELMGGAIGFRSKFGAGSTFTFTLGSREPVQNAAPVSVTGA
jgi:signal transduction histidine kinase